MNREDSNSWINRDGYPRSYVSDDGLTTYETRRSRYDDNNSPF